LVSAMVQKKDRELRSIGMQGFRYAPDVVQFAHIINIHSPRAYQAIRHSLPLPDPRTLQYLIKDYLDKLGWKGPVGLSCDDTKLLPALRPYLDHDGNYYVVGGVGPPRLLTEPNILTNAIRRGEIEKATKIRVWCVQVPMPNIPAIVTAALGITDSLSAKDLLPYLLEIVDGLLKQDIKVVSYAADGTGTERSLQRLFCNTATGTHSYIIRHPNNTSGRDLDLRISRFGTQRRPIAMVQDPPHLRKTLRNNTYSGARLLTLGNFPVLYCHFREVAQAIDGTLYNRDVEKTDRQDDNAATRFFSSHTLEWMVKNRPEWVGPIIYVFVFGDLVDAYENRHLTLIERAHMVLRAHFFMEAWEDFLDSAGYQKGKHLLSHEACDIIRFATRALLQLIIIYRDYFDGTVYPLLPWLLSTATCEHVFGICRQIVKDFTLEEFHYMVPKLNVRLREHFFFSESSDGKARANGYNHTYTDSRQINLGALATYPTDAEIQRAANAAFEEAHSLWEVLGADNLRTHQALVPRLPSVRSWFNPDLNSHHDGLATHLLHPDSDSDTDDKIEDSTDSDDTLDGILDATGTESEMHQLLSAMEFLEDEVTSVQEDQQLRDAHQTIQADKGIRSQGKGKTRAPEESERQALLRQYNEILKIREDRGIGTGLERMTRWRHPAPGGRQGHINGLPAQEPAPGAAANAAEVSTSKAKKVSVDSPSYPLVVRCANFSQMQMQRRTICRKHKLPSFVENANITPALPLVQASHTLEQGNDVELSAGASFGFVFHNREIWLAQGRSIIF
ncbi:hypothetical protein HETIRDRAFT_306089, partial [Heterobasidion irregulare TC 32-1]